MFRESPGQRGSWSGRDGPVGPQNALDLRRPDCADSRESLDSRESIQEQLNAIFANRASVGEKLRIAGLRRFARLVRAL